MFISAYYKLIMVLYFTKNRPSVYSLLIGRGRTCIIRVDHRRMIIYLCILSPFGYIQVQSRESYNNLLYKHDSPDSFILSITTRIGTGHSIPITQCNTTCIMIENIT